MLLSTFARRLAFLSNQAFESKQALHTCACRKTWILERDHELPRPSPNGRRRRLYEIHRVYRVVERKKGPKELDIILTKDSLEHGVAGEVLTVDKHVGRSLIRKFEAVYASPEDLKELASSFVQKSAQTTSGRRMLLWLRTRDSLTCTLRDGVPWTLTSAVVARALQKNHKLIVPEEALELPEYEISSSKDSWGEHDIKITVNGLDTVTVKMNVVPKMEIAET